MDIAASTAKASSRYFATEIDCVAKYDGGTYYEVTAPVFAKGRGVSLIIKRPFKRKLVATPSFGMFGTKLIDVWKSMDDDALAKALRYLWLYEDRLSIDLSMCGIQVHEPVGAIGALRKMETPADFSMRIAGAIKDGREDNALFNLVQCAYGFLLMLSGAIADDEPDEELTGEVEGAIRQVSTTRYERSAKNRAMCIAAHGTTCAVCGFDFGRVYGAFAAGYIEVHHKIPVSQLGSSTTVDPVEDLVPLCPNCHAAVHLSNPPLMPEELKAMMDNGFEVAE